MKIIFNCSLNKRFVSKIIYGYEKSMMSVIFFVNLLFFPNYLGQILCICIYESVLCEYSWLAFLYFNFQKFQMCHVKNIFKIFLLIFHWYFCKITFLRYIWYNYYVFASLICTICVLLISIYVIWPLKVNSGHLCNKANYVFRSVLPWSQIKY